MPCSFLLHCFISLPADAYATTEKYIPTLPPSAPNAGNETVSDREDAVRWLLELVRKSVEIALWTLSLAAVWPCPFWPPLSFPLF
jgi:hypothetical protein